MMDEPRVDTKEAKERFLDIRAHIPDASDQLVELCQHLVGHMSNSTIVPTGFLLVFHLLLGDLERGVNGYNGQPMVGRLIRTNPLIYRALSHWMIPLARVGFGEDFAGLVRQEYVEVMKDSVQKTV